MKSYYSMFGVDDHATTDDIKKAYKVILFNSHPDKVQSNEGKTNEDIHLLKIAYRTLSDPTKREKYDKMLEEKNKLSGIGTGAADGLEDYSLDEFDFNEDSEIFSKDCPRCRSHNGFEFDEDTLEEFGETNTESTSGYVMLIQCNSCSLWLKVLFDDAE